MSTLKGTKVPLERIERIKATKKKNYERLKTERDHFCCKLDIYKSLGWNHTHNSIKELE